MQSVGKEVLLAAGDALKPLSFCERELVCDALGMVPDRCGTGGITKAA